MLIFIIVVLTCVFWCWFFFFKQKTAYELRISDWSSDVCSSDLIDRIAGNRGVQLEIADRKAIVLAITVVLDRQAVEPVHRGDIDHIVQFEAEGFYGEIGRASCRERVCQCV